MNRSAFIGYVAALCVVAGLAGCGGSSVSPTNEEARGVIMSTDSEYAGSSILMQGFYWDSFEESGAGNWWDTVSSRLEELASAGITELWLPPAQKSQHTPSMGYDPYDFFDLGEYDQKGRVETYFGSRAELESLIGKARANDIRVYADLVYNHMSGGALEYNPNTGDSTYTDYRPKSGRFEFNYNNFHPSTYAGFDEGRFGGFADLAHANPATFEVLSTHMKWLKEDIGFEGWRYDYVKGFSAEVVARLQDLNGGFAVAEFFDGDRRKVLDWFQEADSTANMFDFPLFFRLNAMCNTTDGSFDMRNLWGGGILFEIPYHTVTFVENHDTDRSHPVVYDKMMGYAYIMTHEGIPTVFWKDYYNYELARPNQPDGIHRLMWIRKHLARGSTDLLYQGPNAYVIQRDGDPGLILALNDSPDTEMTVTVGTRWKDEELKAYAYRSSRNITGKENITTGQQGNVDVTIPPRGYVIYGPVIN